MVLKAAVVSFPDSGFLFSGSRPASLYKESPSSGIKSLFCLAVPFRSFDGSFLLFCFVFFLSQTTFHWSQEAVRHPQAHLQPLQWLGPSRPARARPGGAPSSAQLVSTSAARSCVCFLQNRNPPLSLLRSRRRIFSPSRVPFTAAAFPTTYHLFKATMVNTAEVGCRSRSCH